MGLRPTLGDENQRRPRESGDPLWAGRKVDSRFHGNDESGRDHQESEGSESGPASNQSSESHPQGGVIGGRQHQQKAGEKQANRPCGALFEKVLFQAHDADGQKQQACGQKVLHLFGNASEHKQAGSYRQEDFKKLGLVASRDARGRFLPEVRGSHSQQEQ